jgi:hypothetical protein
MEQLRTLLLLVFAAIVVTGLAAGGAWWFATERRLRRALKSMLKRRPDAEAVDAPHGRAAGLELESGEVAVLWDKGGSGLVYQLQEVDGAELIVDGQVTARIGRHGDRRALDALPRDAEQVTLRLIFADARWPEFELELWGPDQVARSGDLTPVDAIRLGRRWLSHIDALLRAKPETVVSPQPGADLPG